MTLETIFAVGGEDFPRLEELFALGALQHDQQKWLPTARGLELSDVIGPWLYSPAVREKMAACVLR